ncbi:metal ABC transporter solute-binding protein, Zn/Mn family [Risungbinella massiliensis]|uniref:metal ABC transporter solute-binding protein, Zn/Mn family n=1 Tax=Risungbinella massiliensis TaxID=1329796 RepID=UPI0005CBA847|nr:zinc ABC transporter substrate-binding protein [Risungbinella massiliensis]
MFTNIRSLRWFGLAGLYLVLLFSIGCQKQADTFDGKYPIQITSTTGMVSDLVQNIGKEKVTVQTLMGPGVDPHLYKASHGDLDKLEKADIIFYSGLHLEGKMSEVLEKIGNQKTVVAVTSEINPKILLQTAENQIDPHLWFDVSLWIEAAKKVEKTLIAYDPKNKAFYEQNASVYLKSLQELDTYVRTQLSTIAPEQRVLVTAHDAFGYFGKAYGYEVVGLQGISTASEYGLKDVQRLVDLLSSRKIKAVFVESSVPKKSIEAVVQGAKQKGHSVVIGGELFSDALGEHGTPEGTYIGMVRHNVDTIVQALR